MQNTAKSHLFSIKQFRRCNMGPKGIRYTESWVFVDSTVGTTHHWALPGYISSLLGLFFADLSSLLITEVTERALCNPSTDENVSLCNVFSFKDRSVMSFFFFCFYCHASASIFDSVWHTHTCTQLNCLSDTLQSSDFLPPSGRSCPIQWQAWLFENIISYQAREVRQRQMLSGSDGWASFKRPSGK